MKVGNQGFTSGELALQVPEEVKKFLEGIDDIEHEALFKLELSIGARREDLVAIKTANIHLAEKYVLYNEAKKGNRIMKAYIEDDTAKTLSQIMKLPNHINEEYLFPGSSKYNNKKREKHLSGRQAYNIFQHYLLKAGLEKRPFHTLRSTCMKLKQYKGWPVEKTAKHVGDKIATVQLHYLTPSDAEMKKAVQESTLL